MHSNGHECADLLDSILSAYSRYSSELRRLEEFRCRHADVSNMYHDEERRILYSLVRTYKPQLVIEFSPNKGWSTLHVAHALEVNGSGHIHSFELDLNNIEVARRVLSSQGLIDRVTFHSGDVRKTLQPILHDLGQSVDFLFVDSNHSYDFGNWWLSNVLPSVRAGGLVHIHDVEYSYQYGWAALTLTHQGKGVYGPPQRRFVRVRSWQRALRQGRWSHLVPRRLRDALVPHDVRSAMDLPHYCPGNSVADINASSGPGEALAVKEFLDSHPEIQWLSVMALIENPEYRAAVALYGGGELVPWPDSWGYQRSPSLYFLANG